MAALRWFAIALVSAWLVGQLTTADTFSYSEQGHPPSLEFGPSGTAFFEPRVLHTEPAVGRLVDGILVAVEGESRPGYLSYGPYITLPAGEYDFTVEVDVSGRREGDDGTFWDVAVDLGQRQLFKAAIVRSGRQALSHRLPIPSSDADARYETRVYFGGRGVLRVFGVRITRIGEAAPPIGTGALIAATAATVALSVLLFWAAGFGPRRAARAWRRHRRWIAVSGLLVVAAAYALMLAPPPPAGSDCAESRPFWGPLQMVVSCDSYEFARVAADPSLISDSYRQPRPLQILAASLLTRAGVSHGRALPPEWFSYVMLNFGQLVVALALFRSLAAPRTRVSMLAVGALSLFLLFNDVVKGFFWSAHTQMWNVLMPLVSIGLSLSLLSHPTRSWRFTGASGALLGVGWLAYGSLVVCLVSAIVAMAIGYRIRRERPTPVDVFGKPLLFVAAFAAPMAMWAGLVYRLTGNFITPETREFREFVWILDSWRAGGAAALAEQAHVFLGEFGGHLWNVSWPVGSLVAIVLVAALLSPARWTVTVTGRALPLAASGITLVVCLIFFGLMGFYRSRLAFNMVVPFVVAASLVLTGMLEGMPGRRAAATLGLIIAGAVGYVAVALTRVGPYV